jgi:hypothetical protein
MAGRSIGLAVAVLTMTAAPSAHAIIIRDDVPDADYVVADEEWPALVDLIERGDCIGTLVLDAYLLTVAHCAIDLERGATLTVAGMDHVVADVVLHPNWRDDDEWDIALVRFETPVVDVEPIPIYRGSDELGATITLVGRGVTATGLQGEPGAESDGKLRRATNIVTDADDYLLEVVFERGGERGVTMLEGVGASGDSGCPSFIEVDGERFVAGLNAFGDSDDGIAIGQYGAFDYQTRVSRYLGWIDAVTDDDPATDPNDFASNDGGCSLHGREGATLPWLVLVVTAAAPRRGSRRRISSRSAPIATPPAARAR